MAVVKIVTDSTSDISPELAQQLGMTVVPVYVHFGEKTYRDGVDIDADEVYRRLETGPVHPTTSAPSPGDFTQIYKKLTQEANEIVSIHISNKLSATCDAALQAREALAEKKCRIEVVDSQLVTMALGLIAIMAAKAAQAGEGLQQILEKVRQAIPQTRVLGFADTLKYLARGGRIGKAASLLGAALNVKPLLTVRDGEAHPSGLARTRCKAIDRLFEFVRAALHIQDLGISYSTTLAEAQALAGRINSILPGVCPRIARLGPALGVHTGPSALIVAIREG